MRAQRNSIHVLSSVVLLAAMLLLLPSSHIAAQSAAPAPHTPIASEHAQKLDLNGVPNFGHVTPTLYRGGQPTADSFQELQKLGIEIVVNFRNEPKKIEAERRAVEALGLRYVSIPWSSWHTPDTKQVTEFLELLRANPDKKIFVHCHHGADRTGVMVAVFRMAIENWTVAQALAEMGEFHFHRFWYPHLKSYVEDFPRRLATDPALRAKSRGARLGPLNFN